MPTVSRTCIAVALLACAPPAADPQLADVALKLVERREANDPCGRAETMRALLDATDWTLPPATDFDPKTAAERWIAHANATGRVQRSTAVPSRWSDLLGSLHREAEGMRAVASFVSRFPEPEDLTLAGAIQACAPVDERRSAVADLAREVEARGLGDAGAPGLPLRERLAWAELSAWAEADGGSAPSSAALVLRMDGRPELAPHARKIRERPDARGVRVGIASSDLSVWADAAERQDPAVFAGGARCAEAVRSLQVFPRGAKSTTNHFEIDYAILRDLGCIRGTPARFSNALAVRDWVGAASGRARPWYEQPEACAWAWSKLPDALAGNIWPGSEIYGFSDWTPSYILGWYYLNLVDAGCLPPEDARPAAGG